MKCGMVMRENEMQSPQSTLINPSTDDHNLSILSDITNQQGDSNLNHTHTSALTEISIIKKAPSVNPSSVSVNQQKLKKRSFNKICQVATDLSHRLEQPGRRALFFCPLRPKPPSYRELIAPPGNPPVYAQLYIYDTDNEVSNRISSVSRHVNAENLDPTIVAMLKECLDKHNSIVKNYRKAGDIIKDNVVSDISIRLIRISNSSMLSRQYNMPTTYELAALIVGNFDKSYTKRDIIVKRQSGNLQRIDDQLHMSYLPLQYPLLFPYGDNGYDSTNEHSNELLSMTKKKKKLTPREYLAFCLMSRKSERSLILQGQKSLQEFFVDGYSMVESDRLDYIRKHQKELRVDLYSGLSDVVTRGETDPSSTGQQVILPSSFTGGACYMIQNYQDAMVICSWAGYPDIFITFTCNPMWSDITRHCNKDGLKPCDRPKILSKILFHIKLQKLMRTLKDENIFGSIKAEIPDKDLDRELYELVGSYMVHGPCGRSSNNAPCMKDKKCSKYFPKRYNTCTTLDENGYPTYRRRNDGRTVSRNGVHLDNKFVVLYSARLLKLFSAHLNIEKTNQSRVVKYLFKYISKGNDRVIACIYSNSDNPRSQQAFDEISHYLNCREACYALGLLDDDNEYIDAIKEASLWASGNYLRLHFSSTNKEVVGLLKIEKLLLHNGKSLNDYPSLPKPNEENLIDMSNQLILQELNYNKEKESDEAIRLQNLMTDEQKEVFHKILTSVSSRKGGFFFLHGFGGTGKTFIWNALTTSI
ncbi:hypothetical protein K1719_028315 [Acacia pycnantha]|nr:hypothetical protein K1719_028315 [Acacia pycnantha]